MKVHSRGIYPDLANTETNMMTMKEDALRFIACLHREENLF